MANHLNDFRIINIKSLARLAGLPYVKVRNCIVGTYSSLTDQEKTHLFNKMQEEIEKASAFLGYSYDGKRIRPRS